MGVATPDLELVRHFEPVVRLTRGEQFYPADVERYIEQCSLWLHHPDGREEELVPDGKVTIEELTAPRMLPERSVLYLRLIGALNLAESAHALAARVVQRRSPEDAFHTGLGRLARVGYTSRIIDAVFSVSLLLRGRVPGAIAAAAEIAYRDALDRDPRFPYYARVVREGGWVVLQYWFFYYYNSWRSSFNGANDHESDWEQVTVYLYGDGDDLVPRWVAYASHDFQGDDLRRRWDDREELDLVGDHPVVYAGAGSHASYFRPGEYQTDVSLPMPRRLDAVRRAWGTLWNQLLGQARRQTTRGSLLRIPFVDYARGDGVAIGPGRAREWTPVLLDPLPDWVSRYRGLWGLYARDPISGENAPAGPMYNRDGTVRGAWYHPLGFAGLDKVPPPPVETRILERRQAELRIRQAAIAAELAVLMDELQELGTQVAAMNGRPHLGRRRDASVLEMAARSDAVKLLERERAENEVLLESLDQLADRRAAGLDDDPRAHIVHLARPATGEDLRLSRLAELWAAVSIGLLVLALVGLLYFVPTELWVGAVALLLGYLLIESFFRGTYAQTVTGISVVLAMVALLIVFVHFWQLILAAALVAAAALIVWENTRELWG